uniref:Uncharacterized protein n=1 Tax=Trypanosoma congolense (strain IL3000) TaxID=1068625 RepID=G0V1W6_TRYCI|nr:hypothetical protein, unlikely [Trypanosoma congolense IL3000]
MCIVMSRSGSFYTEGLYFACEQYSGEYIHKCLSKPAAVVIVISFLFIFSSVSLSLFLVAAAPSLTLLIFCLAQQLWVQFEVSPSFRCAAQNETGKEEGREERKKKWGLIVLLISFSFLFRFDKETYLSHM